jgi:hypothetical protein
MATPRRSKSGRFLKGSGKKGRSKKKGRAKKGAAKRVSKKGARRRSAPKRAAKSVRAIGKRERSLETRVRRLEGDMEVVHGGVVAVVNQFRKHAGAKPLARLPGYVSPLGRQTATKVRALPAGR